MIWVFHIHWDLNHPVRVVYALELAANILNIGAQVYSMIAVWMFVLSSSRKKMRFTLESHRTLFGAVKRLMDRFGWILMANTCFTALNLFYSLYYTIEYVHAHYCLAVLSTSFDCCCVNTFRFWLCRHSLRTGS